MGVEHEEKEEEDCDDCQLNAGVIVSGEICKTLKEKSDIDCKELVQDVLDKKITPEKYMDTLIEHAEEIDDPTNADILKEIRRLMAQ